MSKKPSSQNFNLYFASQAQEKELLALGYRYMMVKLPNIEEMPTLSKKERICLKYLLQGLPVKAIAMDMNIAERKARSLASNLRAKFDCISNHQLVAHAYAKGIQNIIN